MGGPLLAAGLYLLLVSSLGAGYRLALRAARTAAAHPRVLASILGGVRSFGALAVLWPGLFSSDGYYYALLGKMQLVYGLNPLVQPPAAMGADPWLTSTPWALERSPYGPIWLAVTWGIAVLSRVWGGAQLAYVLGGRLLNLHLLLGATGRTSQLGSVLLSNPDAGLFAASPVNALRWLIIDGSLALRGTVLPTTLTPHAVARVVEWPLWYGAVGVWSVRALYATGQVRDFAGLIRAWSGVLLSYLALGAVWFSPWYATWLVPLVVLLPAGRRRQALFLLVLGPSLCYAVSPYLPGDISRDLHHYYVSAIIFLPTLSYCAWTTLHAWRIRWGLQHPAPPVLRA